MGNVKALSTEVVTATGEAAAAPEPATGKAAAAAAKGKAQGKPAAAAQCEHQVLAKMDSALRVAEYVKIAKSPGVFGALFLQIA